MSGSLIGGIVGAGIGLIVSGGNPMGALYGWSAGSVAGGLLFPERMDGPRLTDLKPQSSEYGRPIPIVYGTGGLSGNVIWASDYVEESSDSGGKGGPSVTTHSYFGNFAVALCEGETNVLRLWAGPEKRLIWDGVTLEGNGKVRIYKGTEDQLPDPLIESYLGVGNVPAYRGTTYVVFEHFPLEKDGNTIPFITAEIMSGNHGGMCGTAYTMVGSDRLYDVPPVKLGNYGSGPGSASKRVLSRGAHPYASDNDGNLYFVHFGSDAGVTRWFLKKVSTVAPIQESELYLGDAFSFGLPCSIAYDPGANILGIIQESTDNFLTVDCASFTATYSHTDYPKCDIIYSVNEQRLRMLDDRTQRVDGKLSPDCYGIESNYRAGGSLIECGPHGIIVRAFAEMRQGNQVIAPKEMDLYDPIRDRLLAVTGDIDRLTGYYDFATGEVVTPADLGPAFRVSPVYLPEIDRIAYKDGDGITIMNPADFTTESFPDECKLFGGSLLYGDGSKVNEWGGALMPVPIPGARNKIAIITAGNNNVTDFGNDVFTFAIGMRGKGVTLADVVADLSERAKQSHYDVSQLEGDIVDGYTIARQTTVRNAIDALRPAYYFDAVESEGLVKFVKRGGAPVATIDADDLDARSDGQSPGDPLLTTRQMEVELPRVVNVNYQLAATDYEAATKLAKRLVGASGNETTLDLPLVLTDTQAQEIADVNLQLSWVQRLSYTFNLPRKYSDLEPTDHIVVKGNGMRLTKATRTPQGIIKCEAVADGSTYYTANTPVAETPPSQQTVSVPGTTLLELM